MEKEVCGYRTYEMFFYEFANSKTVSYDIRSF